MALTNVVDFYSTPASAKTGMHSRYVTQSNGVVVRKSSIRKLPIFPKRTIDPGASKTTGVSFGYFTRS